VRKEVSRSDQFWLKGQPYSLDNMLDFDDLAPRFEGGTVYQAFLSALSYHRWHSPVSGTIRKVRIVNGTYYLENQFEGFADPQGRIPAPPTIPSRSSPRWRPGHSSSSRPTTPKSA
jgi:phosphatidylserine decarboxylase